MKFGCWCVQALRGSKQQKAGANRRAGIAEDEEDEDMGEDAEEEGDLADGQEGSPRGEESHDAAMDSFVASLLQRTSLNGGPGKTPSTHEIQAIICRQS